MNIKKIISDALHLQPQKKYLLIENLIQSLNEPNMEVDEVWIEELQKGFMLNNNSNVKQSKRVSFWLINLEMFELVQFEIEDSNSIIGGFVE